MGVEASWIRASCRCHRCVCPRTVQGRVSCESARGPWLGPDSWPPAGRGGEGKAQALMPPPVLAARALWGGAGCRSSPVGAALTESGWPEGVWGCGDSRGTPQAPPWLPHGSHGPVLPALKARRGRRGPPEAVDGADLAVGREDGGGVILRIWNTALQPVLFPVSEPVSVTSATDAGAFLVNSGMTRNPSTPPRAHPPRPPPSRAVRPRELVLLLRKRCLSLIKIPPARPRVSL